MNFHTYLGQENSLNPQRLAFLVYRKFRCKRTLCISQSIAKPSPGPTRWGLHPCNDPVVYHCLHRYHSWDKLRDSSGLSSWSISDMMRLKMVQTVLYTFPLTGEARDCSPPCPVSLESAGRACLTLQFGRLLFLPGIVDDPTLAVARAGLGLN